MVKVKEGSGEREKGVKIISSYGIGCVMRITWSIRLKESAACFRQKLTSGELKSVRQFETSFKICPAI